MNQKIGKKQKKKQKAKEKLEQNQGRLNRNSDKQEKTPKPQLSYQKIPIIKTCVKDDETKSSSLQLVNTKNKNLQSLVKQVIEIIKTKKNVEIVGEDMDIPKTISLIEIVKRQLEEEKTKYKQANLVGISTGNKPCFKAVLKVGNIDDQS